MANSSLHVSKTNRLLASNEIEPFIEACLSNGSKNGSVIQGTFEYHITVKLAKPNNSRQLQEFLHLCEQLEIKPILIELPYGQSLSQLMTSSYLVGKYPHIIRQVYGTAFKLQESGFEVIRVKVESLCSNKGVPENDFDALNEPSSRYFEFHFKVLLASPDEKSKLIDLGLRYNAHTSRNAFKKKEEEEEGRGVFVNFLTLRVFGKGKDKAMSEHEVLKSELVRNGFKVLGSEKEYAIYDSNLNLDKGWVKQRVKVKFWNPRKKFALVIMLTGVFASLFTLPSLFMSCTSGALLLFLLLII